MKYKITTLVEDEDENIICKSETYSIESLEEELGKIERSVKEWEGRMEVVAQAEFDRQQEEEHYQADENGDKILIDKESNTSTPY